MGEKDPSEMEMTELSREYLRAVDRHEARKQELLASWAEEYYRPGYLADEEWELLKTLVETGADREEILVVAEVAVYRKVATELGREDEFDDEWPAKDTGVKID